MSNEWPGPDRNHPEKNIIDSTDGTPFQDPSQDFLSEKKLSRRHVYEKRRQAVEDYFINPKNLKMTETESGQARIRTVIAHWNVPENLKEIETEPNVLRVTVYVPGMFECDKPNFGNYPLEIKLAGTMLLGDTEAFVVLKSEGLNREAYVNAGGQGQGLVAEEAVKQLEQSLQEIKQSLNLKEDAKIEFEIIGSSEGSTQGASITEKIIEKNLGQVKAFTSISGAGIGGEDNQEELKIINHLRAKSNLEHGYQMPKTFSEIESDTFLINSQMIGDNKQGGYEYSLGKAQVNAKDDLRNVAKWGWRYLKSSLGLAEEVPHERLQAALSKNLDFEKLGANGVPIIVLAGSQDMIFPAADIQQNVRDLRKKGARVLQLVTNMNHAFPHNNPSGTAMALRLFRDKAGI